ncbi:MAG: hypothetical protein K1X94_33365 [Sandaracinaceae bacterium]|nr:hypothetical protein [Sandaracinaceae bacterium]
MLQRILHVLLAVAAAAGFLFSSVSTSDFTAHLDRQVHGIHCSFVPGADTPDVSGSSGCHVTLMSPYSSVMRDSVWGGIPVSLPSMAVFAYLFVCALALVALRKDDEPRATGYQVLAWALPFLTSCAFGYLSLHELGAACKLCIGIYSSSTIGFLLAITAFFTGRSAWALKLASQGEDDVEDLGVAETHLDERVVDARQGTQLERSEIDPDAGADQTLDESRGAELELDEQPRKKVRLATASEMDRRLRAGNAGANRRRRATMPTRVEPTGLGALALAFVLGVAFVTVPVIAYASGAPDFDSYVGACGTLAHPEDEGHVLVPLGSQTRAVTMLEVLDPLCPSCRGFERRFSAHPAAEQVSRRVLLFPLDSECNWMIDTALHPGACAISEAVLCAEEDADEVLAWAFDHQEEIRERETAEAGSARRMAEERFPSLRSCLGGAAVRAELNRSLRWAVANQLPVLTPQVYVNETRICDEDTDLGLDYVLTRLTARASEGRTSSAGGAR